MPAGRWSHKKKSRMDDMQLNEFPQSTLLFNDGER
ncbi:hypothetical protein Mal65_26930 [Crateriforma conspicua]|nr:hypothetical protein Mal65_26930 [Crateriforma conspicua]